MDYEINVLNACLDKHGLVIYCLPTLHDLVTAAAKTNTSPRDREKKNGKIEKFYFQKIDCFAVISHFLIIFVLGVYCNKIVLVLI